MQKMFSYDPTTNKRAINTWIFAFLVVLTLWRSVLWYYFPEHPADWTGVLAQTFSVLRGKFLDAPFIYTYVAPPYQYGYLYALITAPLYAIAPSEIYSVNIVNMIILLSLLAIVYVILRNTKISPSMLGVMLVFLFTDVYLVGREEVVGVIFLTLVVPLLWDQTPAISLRRQIAVGVLVAFSGLIHPMYGVYGILFIGIITIQKKLGIAYFIRFIALVTIIVAILYGPVILVDVQHWWDSYQIYFSRNPHHVSGAIWGILLRNLQLSPLLYIIYGISIVATKFFTQPTVTWRNVILSDILPFIILMRFLLEFGSSVYLVLLIPFVIWRLVQMPRFRLPVMAVIALLLFAPLLSHYLPTFQIIENPTYPKTLIKILDVTDKYSDLANEKRVWVAPMLSMPVIRNEKSRQLIYHALTRGTEIESGEVILVMEQADLPLIDEYFANDDLVICELVPPVKGLLTLSSFLRERSGSIGLWQVTLPGDSSVVIPVDEDKCQTYLPGMKLEG